MAQTQTHPRTSLHGRPGEPHPPVARCHPRRSTDLRTVRTRPAPVVLCINYPLTPISRAPDPNKQLAENIRRVFAERGHDFFEKRDTASGRIDIGDSNGLDDKHEETSAETTDLSTQPMTPEQLFKMRSDILPRLE